jgi:hypothetical protein
MKLTHSALPIITALSLCALPALAGPSREERQQAHRMFQQAKKHRRAGEHEDAAEAFQQADDLNPAPSYKLGHAQMLIELGHWIEASGALEGCVETDPRQRAEKRARTECAALIDDLLSRIPTLEVEIASPTDGTVSVTVDGEDVDLDDGPLSLDPGQYEIEATAEGHHDWREQIELAEGEELSIGIAMRPAPAEPSPEDERSGGGISPVPAYIFWGLGTAGLGVGIGFGIAAIDATHVVRSDYGCEGDTCPPRAAEDINTAQTDGNVATAGFVIGASCLATGTILYFLSGDDDGDEGDVAGVRVDPIVAPTFLGIQGTF